MTPTQVSSQTICQPSWLVGWNPCLNCFLRCRFKTMTVLLAVPSKCWKMGVTGPVCRLVFVQPIITPQVMRLPIVGAKLAHHVSIPTV